jgi:hypothetical protein
MPVSREGVVCSKSQRDVAHGAGATDSLVALAGVDLGVDFGSGISFCQYCGWDFRGLALQDMAADLLVRGRVGLHLVGFVLFLKAKAGGRDLEGARS